MGTFVSKTRITLMNYLTNSRTLSSHQILITLTKHKKLLNRPFNTLKILIALELLE